jgi:hypothetical protein
MNGRYTAVMLTLVGAMCACHSVPQKQQAPPAPVSNAAPSEPTEPAPSGDTPPPSAEDMPKTETTEIPPCLPADNAPKPAPKRKPKPVVKTEPPPAQPAQPPPKVAAEAGVKIVPAASSSILGKKVRGPDGDDLGRVVDVLADADGRVRIAIVEFGGFLGVGNRRIAIDWSLLKFHPTDSDAPVTLEVDRRQLQGTPEYKGSERPLALMAPDTSAPPRPPTPN